MQKLRESKGSNVVFHHFIYCQLQFARSYLCSSFFCSTYCVSVLQTYKLLFFFHYFVLVLFCFLFLIMWLFCHTYIYIYIVNEKLMAIVAWYKCCKVGGLTEWDIGEIQSCQFSMNSTMICRSIYEFEFVLFPLYQVEPYVQGLNTIYIYIYDFACVAVLHLTFVI